MGAWGRQRSKGTRPDRGAAWLPNAFSVLACLPWHPPLLFLPRVSLRAAEILSVGASMAAIPAFMAATDATTPCAI